MVWGEGFITNGPTIRQNNLSDPSGIFAYDNLKRLGPLPVTIVSAAPPNQVSGWRGRHAVSAWPGGPTRAAARRRRRAEADLH